MAERNANADGVRTEASLLPTRAKLARTAAYQVENVFEALSEQAEWYLDRPAGKLYYLVFRGPRGFRESLCSPSLVPAFGR